MILEITINTSTDQDSFEDLGMIDQIIYAEVSTVNVYGTSKEYALRFCHIICDAFNNPPVRARLTVWADPATCRMYAEYEEGANDGLNYIDIPVTAKTVQGFPRIE